MPAFDGKRFLEEAFIGSWLKTGRAPTTGIDVRLPSGRIFRYDLSEYPFSPWISPEKAQLLAKRIVNEKFRWAKWDRDHLDDDSSREIREILASHIRNWAAKGQAFLKAHPRLRVHPSLASADDVDKETESKETMSTGASTFQELHRLLAHAANLRNEIDRAPKTLQLHKDRLGKQEQDGKDFAETTRKLKVAIHEKEGSLKDLNQKIDKWEGQINSVSSKKEYDALKVEMANARKECQKIEDQVLESMTELETRAARQPQVEKELAEAKQKAAQLIDELQQRRDRFTAELAEVHKQIEAVEAGLVPDTRTAYLRLKDARGEDALAIVENRTCKACYTTITAQNYNDLLANHLVVCKSCGRIMYLPETVKSEEKE